jgi:hypothetical protein
MNELVKQEELRIENMIYEIRGKQVMFSSQILAKVVRMWEPKLLNQAIKRHMLIGFLKDLCFKLTNDEYKKILRLRSQLGTLNNKTI